MLNQLFAVMKQRLGIDQKKEEETALTTPEPDSPPSQSDDGAEPQSYKAVARSICKSIRGDTLLFDGDIVFDDPFEVGTSDTWCSNVSARSFPNSQVKLIARLSFDFANMIIHFEDLIIFDRKYSGVIVDIIFANLAGCELGRETYTSLAYHHGFRFLKAVVSSEQSGIFAKAGLRPPSGWMIENHDILLEALRAGFKSGKISRYLPLEESLMQKSPKFLQVLCLTNRFRYDEIIPELLSGLPAWEGSMSITSGIRESLAPGEDRQIL